MPSIKSLAIVAASSLVLAACGGGSSVRDSIRVVGSSTVYPFATAVAEQAVRTAGIKSPVIESTGTGAGMKLFCAGVGSAHPDIENASRRMKKSEFDDCAAHGVTGIVEVQIGLDGIAFASAKDGITMPLTAADVYKALAANPFGKPNTTKTWHDVNPAFPATPISVYGPPSTSGTRDALAELILTKGCETDPAMKALKETDKDAHKKVCTEVRADGAYVDQGENDNLIVQKIEENKNAVGIFGYSFLEENAAKLQGLTMGGIAPTYATISDFTYPGARPLYIYVKAAHLKAIPGLTAFVGEFAKSWGADGVMKARGMVIAPEDVRARSAAIVSAMTLLDGAQLK
jgi:phosphate transport system substrate-binding protein